MTNLTTKISQTNGVIIEFFYGGNNERMLKSVTNENQEVHKTVYLRGMADYPLMELENNEIGRYYIYGINGLIAMEDDINTYFILKDHLGSTRVVFDKNGNIVADYDYNVFGELKDCHVNESIKYLYTGQEFDWETGLHNYRARMYDSSIMNFLSIDPLHEFANPYSYVGSNPVNFVDPMGMVSFGVYVASQVVAVPALLYLGCTPLWPVAACAGAYLMYLDMKIMANHWGLK